ncbi:nitroreductase family deazaflavin-dependent oxidoreductase [Actinomadura sp. 6N118]|uniref:nitroreductase family deazaflavin-dependent oxidoreductase n=1 Tax=Actinomadura sp. 6N118 TaxID=3375151 RepID=UPI00379D8437
MSEEVFDSPKAWVADHIKRFLDNDGRPRPGMNDLLLTTRGRRSGKLRRTALVYVLDGDRYLLAASNRGAATHPAWYLNLAADPAVTVQIGTETFSAVARTANSSQRPHLWQAFTSAMPIYETYQQETSRNIPVVIVERQGTAFCTSS